MRDEYPGKAPDYTLACVAMFGVNITWLLLAIWAIWGLLFAMLAGYVLKHGIDWLAHWRLVQQDRAIKRGKGA